MERAAGHAYARRARSPFQVAPLTTMIMTLPTRHSREAAEETGVDRSGIEVLGVLPPAYVDVSGFDVTAGHRLVARTEPGGR